MGKWPYRNLGNFGMVGKYAFDLRGIDVVTGGDDRVLQPIDDKYMTGVVHRCDIAAVQPAVRLDRGRSRRLILVVAGHDDGAVDHQFALLAVGSVSADVGEA